MPGVTEENAESPTTSPRQQLNRKPPRNRLSCQVTLLDGTVLTTDQLQKSAKGLDLMHWVTTQLNISEKEYFGLLWEDKKGEKVGDCLFITGYQFSISSFKLKVI